MRLRHRKPQIEGFWREQSTLGSLIYLKAIYGRIYFLIPATKSRLFSIFPDHRS